MKIIDLKTAIIGDDCIFRIVTDAGIDGYAQFERGRNMTRPVVDWFKAQIVGCDPTDINDIMRRIRRMGGSKPWGKIVSTIEMACWDIAGKDAGKPVYKLLGGKVRENVRVYSTRYNQTKLPWQRPDDLFDAKKRAENINMIHEMGGFTLIKTAIGFHTPFHRQYASDNDLAFSSYVPQPVAENPQNFGGSMMRAKGLNFWIDYISEIRELVPKDIDLAFDCGPGWLPADAFKLAKAVEPLNLAWLEDTVTGDFTPYVAAQRYKDITWNTTTNIHTGEEIYLRENFVDLIEGHCVNVIGPDPADVGGIAELKFIAEYANLHGIAIAPHGVLDGPFGLAALTQVCAALPENYVAFEYPQPEPDFWLDITQGFEEDSLVHGGFVKVHDKPGMGLEFNIPKAEKMLKPEDKDFFL